MSEQYDHDAWIPQDGEAVYVYGYPGYGRLIFGKIDGDPINGEPSDPESLWLVEYDEPHACSCGCGTMWSGDAFLKRMIYPAAWL